MPAAPALRLQVLNDAPVNPRGEYVLYWMIANRRPAWNFSLDEAVSWAEKLNKPLLVLEALRAGYPWASDRLHKFIIDGMTDNAGNLGSFYDASSGWVKVDVPSPVVMINTPAARSTIKGVFEMNGSSYHPDANLTVVSVEIRVDDGPWSVVAGTSNWSWVLDTRLLPDGKHDVHVRAYDGSKYSPEVSREFTVKNAKEKPNDNFATWSTFLRMMIVVVVFCAVAVLWLQARRKEQKSR